MTPRAVFDCMVFVQALASDRGPAWACYELVRGGRITLVVDAETLDEVREVLGRPQLRRKLPALTAGRIAAFLEDVERRSLRLDEVPRQPPIGRDPKDRPYLDLAIAAGAPYLVTRDRDLLDLMADPDFRAAHPGLTILDPAAFLRLLAPGPTAGEGGGPAAR